MWDTQDRVSHVFMYNKQPNQGTIGIKTNMKILKFMSSVGVLSAVLLMTSCGSTREYLLMSGSENLKALTKITDNAGQNVSRIAVSPDSPTIFLAVSDESSQNIFKKDNPTSSSMAQITSGNINCSFPSYNPTTDRLAFSYRTRYDANNWTKGDIYSLGFNNVNALSPITQTATTEEYSPSFSPDGTIICYQSKSGSSGEIWTKNIKSNETTLLGSGMQPMISPDGSKIVFSRYKTSAYDSPSSIWVMNIDGTNVTELVSNPNQRMYSPAWSPDGTKIVFHLVNKKKDKYANPDIFVMNADGSGLTQLTTNESSDFAPVWSYDGYIYFISDRGSKEGDYQAWRFRTN